MLNYDVKNSVTILLDFPRQNKVSFHSTSISTLTSACKEVYDFCKNHN